MRFAGMPDTSLAPLLRDRRVSAALAAAAAAQLGATLSGFGGWPCPLMSFAGVPCPGCGLSRACAALARGEWGASFSAHAFAPVLLAALAAFAVAVLLPAGRRESFARLFERLERRTRVTAFLLLMCLLYWSARLSLSGDFGP